MQDLLAQLESLTQPYREQLVIDAKRLQNPLLELHTMAAGLGESATAPIEALLRATTTRSLVSARELDELAESLREALATA